MSSPTNDAFWLTLYHISVNYYSSRLKFCTCRISLARRIIHPSSVKIGTVLSETEISRVTNVQTGDSSTVPYRFLRGGQTMTLHPLVFVGLFLAEQKTGRRIKMHDNNVPTNRLLPYCVRWKMDTCTSKWIRREGRRSGGLKTVEWRGGYTQHTPPASRTYRNSPFQHRGQGIVLHAPHPASRLQLLLLLR